MVEDFNNNEERLGPTTAPAAKKRASGSTGNMGTGDLDLTSTPLIEAERRPRPGIVPTVVPHDGVGTWISNHWKESVAAIFTVAGLIVMAAWYVSKFDSSLTSIQDDVKDVKGKMEKLANDNARQNARLDYVERVLPISKSDIAQPKPDTKLPSANENNRVAK